MDQDGDELREIKREIVESRSLVIKTNHLSSSLSADLKSISKRQQAFEKRSIYTSIASYVLFVAALLFVVKVAWDARLDTDIDVKKRAEARAEKAEAAVKELEQRNAERLQAETSAANFYELVRTGKKRDVISAWDDVRKKPLSRAELAFLGDAVEGARAELSLDSYQAGLDHVRNGRWNEAALSLQESVDLLSDGSHSPSAKLELARVLRRLGRQRDSIPILTQLSESSANKEVLDDATLLLAECLIEIQAYNDAKAALRSFVRRFPDSPLLNDAKMALADLNLKH